MTSTTARSPHLLATPAEDGGQWNMFVALVVKHGLVPKVAMPETKSSSNTRLMNRDISTILRQAARDLRARAADGADADDLQDAKEHVLASIHRLLCIHLGTPPSRSCGSGRTRTAASTGTVR